MTFRVQCTYCVFLSVYFEQPVVHVCVRALGYVSVKFILTTLKQRNRRKLHGFSLLGDGRAHNASTGHSNGVRVHVAFQVILNIWHSASVQTLKRLAFP